MPRGPRNDGYGRIFHVMNRGTARRTMFERPADFRYFLSRLAYAVRRGEIEVLAYALMPTHFHIAVRSLGRLSEALRRIQGEYTRYFNRTRKRDGALQRGRFKSEWVKTRLHLNNLVPYVDDNAVEAGIVEKPEQWQWCSAGARARRRHRQWLSTKLVHLSLGASPPEIRKIRAAFIEARLSRRNADSSFDNVVLQAPEHIAAWMQRKARLADGTPAGLPIAGKQTVVEAINRELRARPQELICVEGAKEQRLIELLQAGLLRQLAGLSFAQIAREARATDSRVKRLYRLHERCVASDGDYARRAARVAKESVAGLVVHGRR